MVVANNSISDKLKQSASFYRLKRTGMKRSLFYSFLSKSAHTKLLMLALCCIITCAFTKPGLAEEKDKQKKAKVFKIHPLDALRRTTVYRSALGSRSGIVKSNNKELYSAKWFEPGSFYGQLFLSEKGYLNIYEWLQVPSTYSLVETNVTRENEFLLTSRSFLSSKSQFIEMLVMAPHPRSFEAIKLGLVPNYQALFPKDNEIEERSMVDIDERRKAELVVIKSGASRLIYTSGAGTRIMVAVEHYRFNQSAIAFMKSLNLGLFDQRIQS